MKSWLIKLFMLTVSLAGCHQDDDVQIDQLYRTWQELYTRTNAGGIIQATSHSSYIVTFRTNGTILYGADGRYPICCNPIRFNRKGNTLDLVDVAAIPIPADVPKADCGTVDCIPPDSTWQIMALTPYQLVIKKQSGTAAYVPYP